MRFKEMFESNNQEELKPYLNYDRINSQDEDGNTFLHYAFSYRRLDLIEQALIYGADLNIHNNASRNALQMSMLNIDPKNVLVQHEHIDEDTKEFILKLTELVLCHQKNKKSYVALIKLYALVNIECPIPDLPLSELEEMAKWISCESKRLFYSARPEPELASVAHMYDKIPKPFQPISSKKDIENYNAIKKCPGLHHEKFRMNYQVTLFEIKKELEKIIT